MTWIISDSQNGIAGVFCTPGLTDICEGVFEALMAGHSSTNRRYGPLEL